MKFGRNEPCPCGSGKKYKKCCLHKQENITRNLQVPLNYRWTEETVYDLNSDSILEHLIRFGIPISLDTFKSEVRNVDSVEELLSKWEILYRLNIKDPMIDFTFLAIKVLASRHTPNHLLLEQIDDLMQEGYYEEQLNHDERAVEKWMEVWKKTLQWIGDKQLTDIGALDDMTSPIMSQLYSNWVQDFEMILANARRYDSRYAMARKNFTNEFLEKFPDSNSLLIQNMIVAKGEALFHLRKFEEAEAVFKDYVQKHSDNVWVYIRWGDLYNPEMHSICPDKERSIYLYRKAIESASNTYDRDIIEDRLYELTYE